MVALVLLIAVTLVGLAAIRGTSLQEKMAGNLQDRDIALQNAEAALRVAASRIAATNAVIWRNCSIAGTVCESNPIAAADAANAWQTVGTGDYTASNVAVGQPEYVVENMGLWPDPSSTTGVQLSGSAGQYGAQGTSTTVSYFRVTARSSNPAGSGDRAVVTLQAWIRG